MTGQDGMTYPQNYDVIVKWLADVMTGETLEIFGVPSGRIEEVCGLEPVDLPVRADRVDVLLRDDAGAWFHLEEQRNLRLDDLYRFASYHFAAARQRGTTLTDIILASGEVMSGEKIVVTTSGSYRPVVIDFTQRDGPKRLAEIREAVAAGTFDQWFELVLLPLYGNTRGEERSRFVEEVLRFETELYKARKLSVRMLAATMILANKLIPKARLETLWEEVKMLDILEIAHEKGKTLGLEEGKTLGRREGLRQGMELGEEKGKREGLLEGIELGLSVKFGLESLDVLPTLYEIDALPRLHAVKEAIRQTRTLAEFTEVLTTKILSGQSSG